MDWTAPTSPGTIDGVNFASLSGYTVTCVGIQTFTVSVAADAVTYTHPTAYTVAGASTCTVTATNTASLSASASGTSSLPKA